MAEKYDGIERYIFSDAYSFFLKFKDMENTDYNWDVCIKEANVIYFKYRNHPLVRCIIPAVINQLEHVIVGKSLEGLTHEQWEEMLGISHKMGW